jgi:hypothetical protein
MDSLTSSFIAKVNGTGTKTRDFGTLTWPVTYSKQIDLAFGTAANQANEMYDAYRTLSASATEDVDLSGSLTNAFGESIVFTAVKGIYIENTSAVDVLSVGGSGSNALASLFGATNDIIKIRPGGMFLICAPDATGYAVTASTADLLHIANGAGGSTTYRIIIVGIK